MKIKDMQRVDLPRERLAKYGPDKLADHELLAILLGSGTKGVNVLELSKRVLAKVREIGAGKAHPESLGMLRGLGSARSAQVIALLALAKRLAEAQNPAVLSAEDVWKLSADIRDSKREHFVAFFLDSRERLIERQVISIGTLNASLVHPREVFEPAIAHHAASIIVAHNHPSGTLEASDEDRDITRRLRAVGSIVGIPIADHVIMTQNTFASFRELRLL